MEKINSFTPSELREQCACRIIDNLYKVTTKKAEVLKKQEAYLNKETPEEYKARKEQQSQRTVKKETPEEYTARIEYMKRKEKVELEVETQRLFEKAEKQHQNHLRYLEREAERSEREAIREAYKNSKEGRERQAEIDYQNTPEGKAERERWLICQKKMYKLAKQSRYRGTWTLPLDTPDGLNFVYDR